MIIFAFILQLSIILALDYENIMGNQELFGEIKDFINVNFFDYLREEEDFINNNIIMSLDYIDNFCKVNKNQIQNFFNEDYEFLNNLLNTPLLNISNYYELYDYICNSKVLAESNVLNQEVKDDYFNYCISLCGRYLPSIKIDIKEIQEKFKKNLNSNEKLYFEKFYFNKIFLEYVNKYHLLNKKFCDFNNLEFNYVGKNSFKRYTVYKNIIENEVFNFYLQVKYELLQEFCAYLLYWIKAYNLTMAIRNCHSQENNIAFSHRYKGWSQPSGGLGDLEIEFKTNFGFGNSSYFCILLEYKGIKIVPFMDWVRYPYYQAYQILQYTRKIHELKTNSSGYSTIFISNEHWQNAMNILNEMINLYLKNERLFVQTYIIEELDNMINRLYDILLMTNEELNTKYEIEENYSKINSEKIFNSVGDIEDLNFKASKICGALGFIEKIIEISSIVDTSNYLQRLKDCNLKLLPMLTKSVIDSNSILAELQVSKIENDNKIKMIFNDDEVESNLKFSRKVKLTMPSKEFSSKYINYEKLSREYEKLRDLRYQINSDIRVINTLLKNIEKYIISINKYVNNENV